MDSTPASQPTLEVGDLVHLAGTPVTAYTVRVVVALDDDGTCLSTYASPAPWLTHAEDRLYRDPLCELRAVDLETARRLELVCA